LQTLDLTRLRTETAHEPATSQNTIGKEIRRRAGLQPENIAIAASSFMPLSYRELQALIDNVRTALRRTGLGRGARIAIAVPNGPRATLVIVAVSCSAVSVPLNPRQTLREIEVCLAAVQPDAVLLVKGADSVVRRVAERTGIKILEVARSRDGVLDVRIDTAQISACAASGEPDEPEPTAPAFILQTSGTAAEPKLIPFSHRNMLAAAARLQSWFNLTPHDRCLSASPPFYSHGLKVTVFTPLLSGGTVAFPADAAKFDYTEWFGALKPTWYSAGPTLHRQVFDQTKSRTDAKTGHSLRFILSGGAPLPREVMQGLQQALGIPVVEHYGSSEGAQIAANLPSPGRSKLGTCGTPWPGTLMIVGEDGRPVPQGEQGEILIGGPTLIPGYLNAPELNRTCFINGWFKTGDIGSLDEDGFLTLHGRKNDLINRGGEKISPSEIDELLMRHPAVAEAAAFSVPHSRLGEDVVAAVVLRSGTTTTAVELRKYLHDQLAPFKVPRRIVIRDQLPKGKTGKVLRRQLSETFEKRSATDGHIVAPPPNDRGVVDTILATQMKELWERLLQIETISFDDDFSEKGGDSLLAMEMLSELERLTGQKVPSSILFEARTIRQLAQKLSALDIQSRPVTLMNRDGSLTPLFLFHGDYNGAGLYAAKLASLLGPDQPLFVVAPHDLGGEPVLRSIEAIAAEQLALVLNAQPKGPYRLCGYCLGGIFAFEIARLLIAAGEKVELVAMIDSPTVNGRRPVQFLLSAMHSARPIIGAITDKAVARAWYICSQLDKPVGPLQSWFGQAVRWRTDERRSSVFAMSTYAPKPVAVPVIYFAAEYDSAAWRRLGANLETIKIKGDHAAAVRDPANLATIADHMRARLQAS